MKLFQHLTSTQANALRHLLAVCGVMLASCAHLAPGAVYAGGMTYPKTVVSLHDGFVLTHQAGPLCKDHSRPEVGTADSQSTFSIHALNQGSQKLCEAPSFLSDPKFEGEFADYYRKNDQLKVFQSATGSTVLIVEDRSPTFPHVALLLLREESNGIWHSSELMAPHIAGDRSKNLYGLYAEVVGITDNDVMFADQDKRWSEPFAK
ncbi:MAG: hypothetical protein JWO89_2849, partial [Verrucomicrobiaceae bacterium]|nr:hypothetical protein [Verrucomicrobiaceae bacterium]